MLRICAVLMILSVVADVQSAGDSSVNVAGRQQFEAMLKAEAPYLAKARATYPSAKERYLTGLPPGYSFAVRKHLAAPHTKLGPQQLEGIYINVDGIRNGKIYGRIDDVQMASFHRGQRISFPESEVEDWVIFHPDGTEEGDVVAKFLKKARSSYTNDLTLSSGEIIGITRSG